MFRARSTLVGRHAAGTISKVSAWHLHAMPKSGTAIRALLAASVVALTLAGCGVVSELTGGSTNAYDGPERPDSEVATIYGHFRLFARPHSPVVEIAGVDDFLTGLPMASYYATVKTLPGLHRIKLSCTMAGGFAFPAITAELKAGKAYALQCHDMYNGTASASISELPPGSPTR